MKIFLITVHSNLMRQTYVFLETENKEMNFELWEQTYK